MLQANRYIVQQIALLAFGATVSTSLSAAEWTNSAGMAVASIYSDNICLSHEDEEGQLVGTATPNIGVKGEGARANMDLRAALEFNTLADSSVNCSTSAGIGNKVSPAPSLRFAGDTVLIQDWFFFDADAYIAQNKINPFGVSGEDNLNGTGNTNTTYRYGLTPYISHRLSDTSSVLLRYSYDEDFNTENIVNDSQSSTVLFDIGSSPQLTRWSFGLSANYSKVEFEERRTGQQGAANNELASARIRSSFQINNRWQINGYVGEERNDFVSVSADTEGFLWDVGALWTPNTRVTVAAGTGDRFFGATPRFDISYRHKRSELRASYKRELTYNRNLRGTDEFAGSTDEFLGPTPTGSIPTTVTNRPILNDRFTLAYTFQARRTTVTANAYHSEQKRAEDGRDSIFIGIGVSARRNLSKNLSFNSSVRWSDREADEERGSALRRDSNTWRVLLGLERQLATNTHLLFDYRYNQRNSEFIIDEYVENRITLTLSHQF